MFNRTAAKNYSALAKKLTMSLKASYTDGLETQKKWDAEGRNKTVWTLRGDYAVEVLKESIRDGGAGLKTMAKYEHQKGRIESHRNQLWAYGAFDVQYAYEKGDFNLLEKIILSMLQSRYSGRLTNELADKVWDWLRAEGKGMHTGDVLGAYRAFGQWVDLKTRTPLQNGSFRSSLIMKDFQKKIKLAESMPRSVYDNFRGGKPFFTWNKFNRRVSISTNLRDVLWKKFGRRSIETGPYDKTRDNRAVIWVGSDNKEILQEVVKWFKKMRWVFTFKRETILLEDDLPLDIYTKLNPPKKKKRWFFGGGNSGEEMSDLRNRVIRLAHRNPELREHLLPLLKESSVGGFWVYAYDEKSRTVKRFGWSKSMNGGKRMMNNILRAKPPANHRELAENLGKDISWLPQDDWEVGVTGEADRIEYLLKFKSELPRKEQKAFDAFKKEISGGKRASKEAGGMDMSEREYDALRKGDRLQIDLTDSWSSRTSEFEVGRKSFSKKYSTYSLRLYFVKDGVAKKSGMKILLFKRVEGGRFYNPNGDNVSLSMGGMGSQIKSWKKLSSQKTARGGYENSIPVGDKVRIRWSSHPSNSMLIEEMPSKPLKRRLRQTSINCHYMVQWLRGSEFLMDNIIRNARFGQNMSYEQAVSTMEKALFKAKEDTIAGSKVNAQKWPGKYKVVEEAWFSKIRFPDHVMNEREVSWLQVEPLNYKPIEFSGKDFSGTAEWKKFEFTSNASEYDYQEGMRDFYMGKSEGAARKLFKMLSAKPDLVRNMTKGEFQKFLNSKKIGYRYVPSVWR